MLLLLLGFAILYAAVFLLLPFFAVREDVARPCRRSAISAVYFAALGLGFMFFEITMIQRLVRFLGYPTYSLTVTLASMLVFTGHRRAAQQPVACRSGAVMPVVFGVLAVLTALLPVRARRR